MFGAASECVRPSRILLGLDFMRGRLVGDTQDLSTWIHAAVDQRFGGAVILDLADVGTETGGSSASICTLVREQTRDWKLYSGGGIKSGRDVAKLFEATCDYCLVATALHPFLE